jgi:hypothetical protein
MFNAYFMPLIVYVSQIIRQLFRCFVLLMERRVGDHKPLNLNGAPAHDAFLLNLL